MFENSPKWLWFGLITFFLIHVISYIAIDPATAGEYSMELPHSITDIGSFANMIKNVLFFDYDYLDGAWFILRAILFIIQTSFIMIAAIYGFTKLRLLGSA